MLYASLEFSALRTLPSSCSKVGWARAGSCFRNWARSARFIKQKTASLFWDEKSSGIPPHASRGIPGPSAQDPAKGASIPTTLKHPAEASESALAVYGPARWERNQFLRFRFSPFLCACTLARRQPGQLLIRLRSQAQA